jgi:polysaccharide chain length determinant protein (PEP-CTERM system associated)
VAKQPIQNMQEEASVHERVGILMSQLRAAWRFRWPALGLAWLITIGGCAFVFTIPNSYQARARVYVDTDTVLRPLLSGLAVNTESMNQVNMMQTALMSRPILAKVMRLAGLESRARTPQDEERMLQSLPKRIMLRAGSQQNTFELTFSDTDRNVAQRVVQVLVQTFVSDAVGIKRADTSTAQQFLLAQIKEYEGRLHDAEERLADFKKRNVGLMPGQAGDYYQRTQGAMLALQDLQAKFRKASDRRVELAKQLEGEEPTFGLVSGTPGKYVPPSAVDTQIAEYQKKLDALLVQYTDKHPEVIALRQTIADLEKKRAAAGALGPASPDVVEVDTNKLALRALDINPVYQNMRMALSQTDIELAELRSQITEQERTLADLRSRVDTVPEVEAQLASLNRDYEVNHAQYTALLQRLESARLSQEAEQTNAEVKFRVIEPPTVPLLPTSPNRQLLIAVVTVLGVAGGCCMAVFLSLLRPVFTARAALRLATGLPVLAAISRFNASAAEIARERRDAVLISAGFAALLACSGVVLVFASRLGMGVGLIGR